MSRGPVEPVPSQAVRDASDWDDEDLLTIAEATHRLAEEINAARARIRDAEEMLREEDSAAIGALHASVLAAERKRLQELVRAAERIKAAQDDTPR